MRKEFLSKTLRRIMFLAVVSSPQHVAALEIQWNYDFDINNFFAAGSNARNTLEAAGNWFETHISDSLLPITSSGSNTFDARFRNPSVVNGAGTDLEFATLSNFNIAADTIMVVAGAVDLGQASAFGGSTIAVAQPGSSSISFTSAAYRDDVISRGQGANGLASDINNVNDVTNQTANDFAMWGGMLSFDIDRTWHDDFRTSPTGSSLDLFSVALHELGHLFGIGTSDIWDNYVSSGVFLGPASVVAFGIDVPLAAGDAHWANSGIGPSPTVDGFENANVPAGVLQEVALDPIIAVGQRKVLTELDVAGLRDVGWQVTTVPVPPALWLLLSAGITLVTHRRQHVGAGVH